jgi:hypothetical protein
MPERRAERHRRLRDRPVLAFGFELTNPTLGIDDYLHLGREVPASDSFWIGRGMWGGLLLQNLMPGGWITPFITLVIGLSLQLLTAIVLGWLMRVEIPSALDRAILYSTFVAYPYFAEQMAFSYLQVGYPLSHLLGVAGILVATSKETVGARTAVGVALVALSISIYQGTLGLVMAAVPLAAIGTYLSWMGDTRPTGRQLLRAALGAPIALVGGLILYFLAHKAILFYSGFDDPSDFYSVSPRLGVLAAMAGTGLKRLLLVLGIRGADPSASRRADAAWDRAGTG